MADETTVKVKNLNHTFSDHRAVKDVSFSVRRGEILGLLGVNGAGKSTTMKMLAGIIAPDNGEVLINDLSIKDQPIKARASLGYLPEKPPIYPDMAVDDFLKFAGKLRKIPRSKLNDAVNHVKEQCGLQATGKRLIKNLSKGYQQRTGIAQAIIHQPDVVILDEPTVGLDPIQIQSIRELILSLGKDHSVILSTHILPEVQAVCDRVLILHHGCVLHDSSLASITQKNNSSCIEVEFKHPPSIEQLQSIEQVIRVEKTGAGRFLITHQQAIEALLKHSQQQHWALQSLVPQTESLENLFVQLTCGEQAIQT